MMNRQRFEFEEILAEYPLSRNIDLEGEGASLEQPIRRAWLSGLFWVFLFLFAVLGWRIFSLTTLHNEILVEAAERSRERSAFLFAPRGSILDRYDNVIVDNEAVFSLTFDPLEARRLNAEQREEVIVKVAQLAGVEEADLRRRMEPYEKQSEPRVIFTPLSQQAAVALSSSGTNDFLRAEPFFSRRYSFGASFFSALLGYVGAVTLADIQEQQSLHPRELIGKTGVERSYDDALRGVPGRREVVIDAKGKPQRETVVTPPQIGNNVRLTVDAELTNVFAEALERGMQRAGSTAAAAVALDPRDGGVLALLSFPTYDLSTLGPGKISQAEYAKLLENPGKPFLNRAIGGIYPSGSTIKPFIAAAALAEDIISPQRRIDDTAGYIRVQSIYDPAVSWTFHDWKPHGFVNMIDAIAKSANVYFYTVGGGYGNIKGLGVERIEYYLRDFGFGDALGIDLDSEEGGRIPNPEWKQVTLGEQWFIGDTYNISIGQGNIAVTPLQLAAGTAAIANGGKLYQPRVAEAVLDANKNVIMRIEPTLLRTVTVADSDLSVVRKGMRSAVTSSSGTNRMLSDLPMSSAAKTGTAQFGNANRTHALVTAFAPYEEPTIVLAIILEGGGEGTAATAVAKEVLAWYSQNRLNE